MDHRYVACFQQGLGVSEAARVLGVDKSHVSRMRKKWLLEGTKPDVEPAPAVIATEKKEAKRDRAAVARGIKAVLDMEKSASKDKKERLMIGLIESARVEEDKRLHLKENYRRIVLDYLRRISEGEEFSNVDMARFFKCADKLNELIAMDNKRLGQFTPEERRGLHNPMKIAGAGDSHD